jgi:hypothetical protein
MSPFLVSSPTTDFTPDEIKEDEASTYRDSQKSPYIREIHGGVNTITIDIDQFYAFGDHR